MTVYIIAAIMRYHRFVEYQLNEELNEGLFIPLLGATLLIFSAANLHTSLIIRVVEMQESIITNPTSLIILSLLVSTDRVGLCDKT